MPEREMRRAEQFTFDCDLFLAVGSSLVVWPAAGFPLAREAKRGSGLVIINREETEFDAIADLVVSRRHRIGAIFFSSSTDFGPRSRKMCTAPTPFRLNKCILAFPRDLTGDIFVT